MRIPILDSLSRRTFFIVVLIILLCVLGFDTIHAHTVKNIEEKIIVVSKDNHFNRLKKLKNVVEILKASEFLNKY